METLYIIKHKMSGMVDDHDVITNDPEAWIKERNKKFALDNFQKLLMSFTLMN